MGLPDSRERTYNDDTPVDPNDLNAIQDAIIHMGGVRSRTFAPQPFITNNPADAITFDNTFGAATWTAGTADARFSVPSEEGQIITSIKLAAMGDGVSPLSCPQITVLRVGGNVDFFATPSSNIPANGVLGVHEYVLDDPYQVLEGDVMILPINAEDIGGFVGVTLQAITLVYQP